MKFDLNQLFKKGKDGKYRRTWRFYVACLFGSAEGKE